ncbi:MAG TPA: hypothetical protein VII56_04345 [Rhizomicrobium sp.]
MSDPPPIFKPSPELWRELLTAVTIYSDASDLPLGPTGPQEPGGNSGSSLPVIDEAASADVLNHDGADSGHIGDLAVDAKFDYSKLMDEAHRAHLGDASANAASDAVVHLDLSTGETGSHTTSSDVALGIDRNGQTVVHGDHQGVDGTDAYFHFVNYHDL